MSPTIFRSLIIFSVLLDIASAAVDAIVPNLIPSSLTQAYENVPTPAISGNPLWLALLVVLLLMVLVSAFGLLFFKRWARMLSLYTTGFVFVIYPFFGITLASGWANAFTELSATIWGAVLAIAYFSSLSERFAKEQKNAC
jgi:hypothetical protein